MNYFSLEKKEQQLHIPTNVSYQWKYIKAITHPFVKFNNNNETIVLILRTLLYAAYLRIC